MGYIGNQQTEGFSKIPPKQDLTGATGASLILSHAVSSPESIDLFINNVRQEPTESYTTDGNTVNLVGYTVAATDDIYVVYNALAQHTSTHPSNQALAATTGTFSGALSATTGTFSGAVSMGANNITFSDGSGIDFSASAGSGASSSILDDYEEGTWTPVLVGGTTTTYTSQIGRYTKIGQLVHIYLVYI